MANISKLSGVAAADIAAIDSTAIANIASVSGVDTPLLLDVYTGAVAAYSVRHINTSYTGACMRVREASGNTETDIGFDSSGYLDVAAIASHCSGAVGYVTKWYSQATAGGTGVGNDAEQATTSQQPRIYSGSSVYTDNGVAAIEFLNPVNGNIGFDIQSNVRSTLGASSVIAILHLDVIHASGGFQRLINLYNAQNPVFPTTGADATYGKFCTGDGTAGTAQYIKWNTVPERLDQKVFATTYDGTSHTAGGKGDVRFFVNAVEKTVHTDGTGGFYVPASGENSLGYRNQNNTQGIDGTMQEVLIFDTDQSSNLSGISSNMETYFSIT